MLTLTVTPRTSELGATRHVANTVPPTWFEEARLPFLQEAALPAGPDCFWMVRHAAYSYEREIFHDAAVEIRSAVQSIGQTSATLYQEAWQHGACAVSATVTLVLFDTAAETKITVPAASRALLALHTQAVR